MLAAAIKDLKIHFSNTNLPLKKSTISFRPLVQKEEASK